MGLFVLGLWVVLYVDWVAEVVWIVEDFGIIVSAMFWVGEFGVIGWFEEVVAVVWILLGEIEVVYEEFVVTFEIFWVDGFEVAFVV